jgi:hypothetical protein
MPPPREPRTISEYFLEFRKALEKEFDAEDPGRSEQHYLVADHIGTKSKRQLTLYITDKDPEKAKKYVRVSYKLPVSAEGSPLFDGDGDEILPAEGPTFTTVEVPAGSSVVAEIAKHLENEAPWASEIERVQGVYESAKEGSKIKRTAKNIIVFWKEMRERVYDEVYYISIRIRRRLSGRPAESLTPRVRTTRRSTRNRPSQPRAVSASPPPEPRHITPPAHTRKAKTPPRHKPNSDPSVPRLPRDPVTGKIIRRRRPDSDPKDEEE